MGDFDSRNEQILEAMINGTEYSDPPQSRIEALLLELKEVIEQGGGSSGHTYSEDEQIVGTWIDGRSIYEKTLTSSDSYGDTFNYIPHGVTNFDQLLEYFGYCTYGSSDKMNIPSIRGTSYVTVSSWDATNIRLERANLSSAISGVKLVIRYIKSST